MKILFLFCFLLCNEVNCAPVAASGHKKEVVKYLEAYGYLPENENSVEIGHNQLHHALKRLQRFASIPTTGEIDDKTIEVIKRPRCGVPDVVPGRHRQKRFELLSDKWPRHNLTWFFDHKNGRFQRDAPQIRAVINEALNVWALSSVLTFEEARGPEADILISFEKPFHPVVDPYEMATDVLAHAFGPGIGIGGDGHFRESIQWDFDSLSDGRPAPGHVSFFSVALHELGHSLGLSHSSDFDAVMYFSYSNENRTLSADDIKGIQHIYGVPKKHEVETTTWIMDNSWPEKPDECNTSYDAITLINQETYIFKGIYYWRPDISDRDAVEMRQTWKELPKNMTRVDAVFQKSGEIFFFIGRDVYVFNDMKLSYTTTLAKLGIDHHFNKIDAVFKWHLNKRVYIFSGEEYWRWDEEKVDKHYPKDIVRSFRDVYDIDTAFSDDEKLYFFKGTSFYEFSDSLMRLNRMNALPSAQNFMKCDGTKAYVKVANRFGEIDDFIDITPSADENTEVLCSFEIDPRQCIEEPPEIPIPKSPNGATTQDILVPFFLAAFFASQVLPTISLHF